MAATMSKAQAIEIMANAAVVNHAALAAVDVQRAVGIAIAEARALHNDSPAYHAACLVYAELDTQSRTPIYNAILRAVRKELARREQADARIRMMDEMLAGWRR